MYFVSMYKIETETFEIVLRRGEGKRENARRSKYN
jgi:hypothetical protein